MRGTVTTRSDEELVQALAAGDADALGPLLDRYWQAAYRYAARLSGGDAQRAEDVAQDVFLTVLERPGRFRAGRAFRPWFYRLVQNRARDAHRRARARRRREGRVARREAEPLAEGEADAELVARHLDALEPDLRRAVTLKHVEGLTFREVAEVLGVPEGTAASRVRRGLESLRVKIEPALASELAAGLVAELLGLLRTEDGPPAPAAGRLRSLARRGAPATALGPGAWALTGLAAAAVVVVVGLFGLGRGEAARGTTAPVGSSHPAGAGPGAGDRGASVGSAPPGGPAGGLSAGWDEAPEPTRRAEREPASGVGAAPLEAPGSGLLVRVLDPDGRPVEGALVEYVEPDTDTSDVAEHLPPAPDARWQLRGGEPRSTRSAGAYGARHAYGVESGAPDRAPPPDRDGVTDGAGRVHFEDAPPGAWKVVARLGFACGATEARVPEGGGAAVDLALEREVFRGELRVRLVEDTRGAPLADRSRLRLALSGGLEEPARSVRLGPEDGGVLRWVDLLPVTEQELTVWGRSTRPDGTRVSWGQTSVAAPIRRGEVSEVTVRLRSARAARLRVVTPDGRPVDRGLLSFSRTGAWTVADREERALDAEGRATLGGLGVEPLELLLEVPGYAAQELTVRPGPEEQELRLEAAEVSVRVLDPAGRPVAGASVSFYPHAHGRTDGEGVLRLGGFAGGEGTVIVTGARERLEEKRTFGPGVHEVRFASDLATLRGRVLGPAGEPVRAVVLLEGADRRRQVHTAADGSFELRGVEERFPVLRAVDREERWASEALRLEPGEVRDGIVLIVRRR